jgi:tetratricopeptide (TPR) repeat protein
MKFSESRQRLAELAEEGRRLHVDGQLDEAERIFREILTIDAGDPESLHRLGLILDARGQCGAAIDHMQRSILRAPAVPEFFNNLGEAQRKAGRAYDAQRSFERALQLRPAYAEALNNLALVVMTLNSRRAVECARAAVGLSPHVAQMRTTLGEALYAVHDYSGAAEEFRAALRLAPHDSRVQLRLIAATAAGGACVDSAVEHPPASVSPAEALYAAGEGHYVAGRAEHARAYAQRVLEIDPRHVNAAALQGAVYNDLGQPEAALEVLARARGVCDASEYRLPIAIALLASGRLREGFREYECRPMPPAPTDRGRVVARWTGGQSVAGKTVLLTPEQGFGDTIQFVRFVPLVKALGATVRVQVDKGLLNLIKTVEGIDQALTADAPAKHFDFYCPMAGLPFAFGTDLEDIPRKVPYLHADATRVASWRERIENIGDAKLRVGLVWQGNPAHAKDRARSIPLARLAGLASTPGVRLFSLQKNEGREQIERAEFAIHDLAPALHAFDDTAAAIEALDLVITVDTSVAHLAGAQGRPVWTLIAIPFDWRWMRERTDSPWYPTMRLYRQARPGEWFEVIERVKADLANLAGVSGITSTRG